MDFPVDMEDHACVLSLIEVMKQSDDFTDEQFKIEKKNVE